MDRLSEARRAAGECPPTFAEKLQAEAESAQGCGCALLPLLFLLIVLGAGVSGCSTPESQSRQRELHEIDRQAKSVNQRATATAATIALDKQATAAAIEGGRALAVATVQAEGLALVREGQQITGRASTFAGSFIRFSAGIAGGVLIIGSAFWSVAWLWKRVEPLVWPDGNERLPVPRRALVERPSVSLRALADAREHHTTRAIAGSEAIARKAPDQLHYAPSVTYAPKFSNKQDIQGAEAPTVAASVPTFSELLGSGTIGSGKPLILGYTAEGAITGDWTDLYSAAVAGVTGSGKTTTTRFLACQGALQGAQFAIIDPHIGKGGDSLAATLAPLQSAFRWQPATDDKAIGHMAALVMRELVARSKGLAPSDRRLIVAIDELTALLKKPSLQGPLSEMIEAVAQEGRGFGVACLLMGQIWSASRSGGTELRDSLASAYVHRIKRAQARFLIPPDEAQLAERLETGSALLARTDGTISAVRIPNTTSRDVMDVAEMTRPRLVASSEPRDGAYSPLRTGYLWDPSDPPGGAVSSGHYPTATGRESAAEVPVVIEPPDVATARKRADIAALLDEGASMTRIIRDVWGATGGGPFYDAKDELQEHLAAMGRAL